MVLIEIEKASLTDKLLDLEKHGWIREAYLFLSYPDAGSIAIKNALVIEGETQVNQLPSALVDQMMAELANVPLLSVYHHRYVQHIEITDSCEFARDSIKLLTENPPQKLYVVNPVASNGEMSAVVSQDGVDTAKAIDALNTQYKERIDAHLSYSYARELIQLAGGLENAYDILDAVSNEPR